MQTRKHIFKNLHMNKYDLLSLVMHSNVDYDNKYVCVQLAWKTNLNIYAGEPLCKGQHLMKSLLYEHMTFLYSHSYGNSTVMLSIPK